MRYLLVTTIAVCLVGVSSAQNRQQPGGQDRKQPEAQRQRQEPGAQQQPGRPGQQRRDQRRQSEFGNLRAFLKQHDRNNDGMISKDELPANLQDQFAQLDRDRDGKLSRQELQAHSARMGRRLQPSQVTFFWIYEIDPAQAGQPTSKKNLQQAYQMLRKIDADNDGQITDQEIQTARKQHAKEHIQAIVQELDEDNDGKLSRDETQGHLLESAFEQIDRNDDSQLTREELMQACTATASTRPRAEE